MLSHEGEGLAVGILVPLDRVERHLPPRDSVASAVGLVEVPPELRAEEDDALQVAVVCRGSRVQGLCVVRVGKKGLSLAVPVSLLGLGLFRDGQRSIEWERDGGTTSSCGGDSRIERGGRQVRRRGTGWVVAWGGSSGGRGYGMDESGEGRRRAVHPEDDAQRNCGARPRHWRAADPLRIPPPPPLNPNSQSPLASGVPSLLTLHQLSRAHMMLFLGCSAQREGSLTRENCGWRGTASEVGTGRERCGRGPAFSPWLLLKIDRGQSSQILLVHNSYNACHWREPVGGTEEV